LNVSTKIKIALLGVLSISILSIVAAFVRMFNVQDFNETRDQACKQFPSPFPTSSSSPYSPNIRITHLLTNPTVSAVHITTWSAVEVQTGLFCASAPCIKPVLQKLFPRAFTTASVSQSTFPQPQQGSYNRDGTFQRHTGDEEIELAPMAKAKLEAGRNWYDSKDSEESERSDVGSGILKTVRVDVHSLHTSG
jgi:hypothetical protein